jgi:xylulokinase
MPYLSGERTPHNDTAVRGGFVNVGHETTRAQMTRAVLEGVAFAFRDAQAALRAAGTVVGGGGADLIGGGSRSALWAQVLADVLRMELHQVDGSDAGCALGAARLGRMAVSGDLRVGKPARLRSFAPDAARAARYDEAYAAWRTLYPVARDFARAASPGVGTR